MLEKLRVAEIDFSEALKIVRPSALREVLIENPNVHWSDVGGLEKLKATLKESIEWPVKYKEEFSKLGIKPSKGILLYGPPGTGKTLLAKAIATESAANFISVKGPALFNMWVGESEKGLRKIFEKARQAAPAVIFFDEIDSIAPKRSTGSGVTKRVVNTLLSEMDGIEQLNDVIVIAATNRPDILDPALLRPGRFDKVIAVQIPDKKSRLEIFKVHTSKMLLNKDIDFDKLAEKTENYSGADIESLCREAGMIAMRSFIYDREKHKESKDIKEVKESKETKTVKKSTPKKPKLEIGDVEFNEALKRIGASIPPEELKKYQELEEEYIRIARTANIKDKPESYFG
jgi:transitional endoplasmic reticulum ATPase